MSSLKVGIICGRRVSNAVIIKKLEQEGFQLKICQYQIPLTLWIHWISKKIKERGFFVLVGQVFLSFYLRGSRFIDRILGRYIWNDIGVSDASWYGIKNKITFCFSEDQLIKQVYGVDVVVCLDQFRFSHTFFRRIQVPIFELVYGKAPEYMGDSAGWWAASTGDFNSIGCSVIERKSQYNKFRIIKRASLTFADCGIRRIKVAQVGMILDLLPGILNSFSLSQELKKEYVSVNRRIFTAPTLLTYLKFLKNGNISKFPLYAYKDDICQVIK